MAPPRARAGALLLLALAFISAAAEAVQPFTTSKYYRRVTERGRDGRRTAALVLPLTPPRSKHKRMQHVRGDIAQPDVLAKILEAKVYEVRARDGQAPLRARLHACPRRQLTCPFAWRRARSSSSRSTPTGWTGA